MLRTASHAADLASFGPDTPALPHIGDDGPFAAFAREAHAAGLVVIPTAAPDAKRPLVRWGQLKGQPRASTLDRWANKFPGANLAYLPGPSGLVVLDIDDLGTENRARALLGLETAPVLIASGRGLHIPMRAEQPIPTLDLRRFGIVGELKGAGSIMVGPGSIHPHTGRRYRFLAGNWDAFSEAPMLDMGALQALLGRPLLQGLEPLRTPGERRNHQGRRNDSTFAHLRSLGAAGLLTSESQVLDAARIYNAAHNDPPEPDSKVVATSRSVWRYIKNGTCKATRQSQYARLTGLEHAALRSLRPEFDYADTLALLMEIKLVHAARSQRGETFALAATAMARERIIPGWGDRKRYLRATRALLACGLVERVEGARLQKWTTSDGKARMRGLGAAQYRFVAGRS